MINQLVLSTTDIIVMPEGSITTSLYISATPIRYTYLLPLFAVPKWLEIIIATIYMLPL